MGVASRETPHSLKAHFEYSDTCAMVTKGKGMANRHDRRRSGRWKGRQGLWYRRDAGYSSQSAAAEALHGRMLRQQSLQQRLHRWMLLTLMAVCVSLPVGAASPFTRVFVPLCKPINEPPPMGYVRWSSAATWVRTGGMRFTATRGKRLRSASPGPIPGVGSAKGAFVTVPCGVAVLLDVPKINITLLTVQGLLRVEDPFRIRRYTVDTSFVVVQGQLYVGNRNKHFRSSIDFRLRPNPDKRKSLIVQAPAYPDKFKQKGAPTMDSADVGHKAFAVVGGQVALRGMPAGGRTPSWLRLAATIKKGDRSLLVEGNVRGRWQAGAKIGVAPTSFFVNQTELKIIRGYGKSRKGTTRILVNSRFQYKHFGDPRGLPDGFGGFIDERAEVGLLTRRIRISSPTEPEPNALHGGHFIIFFTQTPQYIEGVEFAGLGQQGILGRYPVHFHGCGDTRHRNVVRKNAVHDSHQRCYVIHATHNVTVEHNVAFNTSGHCYIVEDGGEQGNVFYRNLGMLTKPAFKTPPVVIQASLGLTDAFPSTFWLTNLANDFIENVAAGSVSSGFWTEIIGVRLMSKKIPDIANADQRKFLGGIMRGNRMHSNGIFGFRAYPIGMRGVTSYIKNSRVTFADYDTVMEGYTAYKNPVGFFFNGNRNVKLLRSTLADNIVGIWSARNINGLVKDTLFVGRTRNAEPLFPCTACGFSLTSLLAVHSLYRLGSGALYASMLQGIFGVAITNDGFPKDDATYDNCRFSNFRSTTYPSSAVTLGLGTKNASIPWSFFISSQTVFKRTRLNKGSTFVWYPFNNMLSKENRISATQDLALRDADGSLVGGNGGTVVFNYWGLPPRAIAAKACKRMPHSIAYGCRGICYRSVMLTYTENPAPDGSLSSISLVRESDGYTRKLTSVFISGLRRYIFSVLANKKATIVYRISIQPPKGRLSFWPRNLTVGFVDKKSKACAGGATLRIMGQGQDAKNAGKRWITRRTGTTTPADQDISTSPFQFIEACWGVSRATLIRLQPWGEIGLTANLDSSSQASWPCSQPSECAATAGRNLFQFSTFADTPREFHNPGWDCPLAPCLRDPLPAPFGHNVPYKLTAHTSWDITPDANAVYARANFTITQRKCFTDLVIYYFPAYGLAVYLNGVEAFRFNLPQGPLTSSTTAIQDLRPASLKVLASATIPLSARLALRNGANLISYEIHTKCNGCKSYYFNSLLSLRYRC